MRVLFLTQVLPFPLDAGPKVRAYYVLRHLADSGHAVTLASFRRAGDTPGALAQLRQLCAAVHTVPMIRSPARELAAFRRSRRTGRPFLIERDEDAAMRALVRSLAKGTAPEVVHADQLWMASYAKARRSSSVTQTTWSKLRQVATS